MSSSCKPSDESFAPSASLLHLETWTRNGRLTGAKSKKPLSMTSWTKAQKKQEPAPCPPSSGSTQNSKSQRREWTSSPSKPNLTTSKRMPSSKRQWPTQEHQKKWRNYSNLMTYSGKSRVQNTQLVVT
eukprot:Pompholyxophrys_punicea_v1_NODE_1182_length_882_cov_2.108827.p2 type:complete len:128 gc:universal NODE_1182_length_882_cov_2.108827:302-685(+)